MRGRRKPDGSQHAGDAEPHRLREPDALGADARDLARAPEGRLELERALEVGFTFSPAW